MRCWYFSTMNKLHSIYLLRSNMWLLYIPVHTWVALPLLYYNPQQSRNYPGGAYTNNHLQNPYVYVVSTNTTESAPARNIQDGSSYVATAMNNNNIVLI
jgi:hypothetical protein